MFGKLRNYIQLIISRAPTTLKSEGEVTSLSGADKREGRSGDSTGGSQNISLIVPLFTFAGHYRGISYVIMYLLCIKVYSVVV